MLLARLYYVKCIKKDTTSSSYYSDPPERTHVNFSSSSSMSSVVKAIMFKFPLPCSGVLIELG